MNAVTYLKSVEDCFFIQNDYFHDDRGFFYELFNKDKSFRIEKNLTDCQQVSISKSHKNVLRGIHTSPYSKLVTCITGKIIDYCIDLREDSSTYLNWVCCELDFRNPRQFYIPASCGHMFVSLENDTTIVYIQGGTFVADNEMEVNYKDPILKIDLPVDEADLIISKKDRESHYLKKAQEQFKKRSNSAFIVR